jgi:disintegrin and metalloproteinase domain-containing protein 10
LSNRKLTKLSFIERLNEYISRYETLNYNTDHVHASHSRAKRSVTKDHLVYLKFKAHGHDFHIRLKRDLEVFSDNLVVDTTEGQKSQVDTSHVYNGQLIGEHNSYVFGSIIDGVFEGKIVSPNAGSFYVEKAKHYFPNGSHINEGFHSIIYNEKHVDDPYNSLHTGKVFT